MKTPDQGLTKTRKMPAAAGMTRVGGTVIAQGNRVNEMVTKL